jgi:hypothetical protein
LIDLRGGIRNDMWRVTGYINNLFNDDTLKASAVYIRPWQIVYLNATGRTPLSIQAPARCCPTSACSACELA